jgi:hypothetical protein
MWLDEISEKPLFAQNIISEIEGRGRNRYKSKSEIELIGRYK